MADLAEGQYEIVDPLSGQGYTFGRDRDALVTKATFGDPAVITNDSPAPRSDGVYFGRDYRGGRTVTFEGSVLTDPGPTAALDALGDLESAWLADDVRTTPSATAVLRMRRGGRLRRVYGRPRRFAATSGYSARGWVPYTADFTTIDHLYYADTENVLVVPYVPASLGGLIGPLTGPWTAATRGTASGHLIVGGTRPAWLGWGVHGPITNPSIEVVGRWSATLDVDVAYDQTIWVRPAPWERSVRRVNDGANFSGKFTADSVRLSQMRVPPGQSLVLLRGLDPTGTSFLTAAVRDTFASY